MSWSKNLSRRFAVLQIFEELWQFMRVRKKWWLAPMILILLMLAVLLALAAGTPFAPFIYTVF